MSDLSQNKTLVKAVSAGAFATAIDKYVLQTPNMSASAFFGASVGAGILATSMITGYIPSLTDDSMGLSTGAVKRGIEIGITSAGSYLLYAKGGDILMAGVKKGDFDLKKVGIVVMADFFGEFVSGWMAGDSSLMY